MPVGGAMPVSRQLLRPVQRYNPIKTRRGSNSIAHLNENSPELSPKNKYDSVNGKKQ